MNSTQTADTWREHFSTNAADLLAIIRWSEGLEPTEFQALLMCCFKVKGRGMKLNTRTVEQVLEARHNEDRAETRRQNERRTQAIAKALGQDVLVDSDGNFVGVIE
jgi:hypothetical protein